MIDKADLRKNAKIKRKEARDNDGGMAARLIASKIIMMEELDEVKTVAGYVPIQDELDLMVTLKALHTARFPIALPGIVGDDKPLEFRSWDMRSELKDGPFGTKESAEDVVTPEVILVPLLAFDENGGRLGYGGGFYDRTLSKLRAENADLIAVGIAYEGQKIDQVPMDDYDQRLDMIVTEKEFYRV
ncbi:5-formyltetrahydrofolate cyclo-ligase [Pseudemcibacter aquimaris]|uniref:5-formyltetrahydrofolate cyclo-ligase n=1 Tax=Pseudemcibacter aquimaris TaxID=2857064 RepID=UPI002013221E|nr:5-formyltetrahydrofolate cyclo-ligase [Pseudemcibacter aquimaris]MCC3862177.1 5-formyltetrahydrofolate cyclo-ligase [Pseudemcibacter aquimaris]WDU58930.1 5-formyltetrahydrofolate cyclo-ligase [Pseudemcibacter aquimaris]